MDLFLCFFIFLYFLYFIKTFIKYEYIFDKLKEIIYQLELRLEKL